jgi:hypothetical protein
MWTWVANCHGIESRLVVLGSARHILILLLGRTCQGKTAKTNTSWPCRYVLPTVSLQYATPSFMAPYHRIVPLSRASDARNACASAAFSLRRSYTENPKKRPSNA